VPLADIRQHGHDVRVALYAPSPHVSYAMFDGGGVAFAEEAMKAGRFRVEPSGTGERPDLTGLSCRWLPMHAQRGEMVSIIVRPVPGKAEAFRKTAGALLALLGEAAHPVPRTGPAAALISPGMRLEALATRGKGALWPRLARTFLHNIVGWTLFRTGWHLGAFKPDHYRAVTAQNADARKFGDGLMLTVDCDGALAARVKRLLDEAADRGDLHFGMVRQDAAVMTCIVPSYQDHGHYHFLDGAGGGYAAAAKSMR